MLKIDLLGSLQVKVGAETAVFRTDALRVLLAYLAAHQGIPQRRDTLAGLLSPDRPDKEALTYLRNRLTRLRQALGDETAVPPYLNVDRKQIALRTGDDIIVDLITFDQHLAAVQTHPHRQLAGCPTCLARLETAVDLMRGELLAGLNFPSEPWQVWLLAQREHTQQRALAAMTLLCEAQMARGKWTAVLDLAQRELHLEPWLESAHRARMQAHTHLGDRNAALAQYEQCQQLLQDELGVAPEEETTALFEAIKAADSGPNSPYNLQPATFPNNLPLQTGPFFGREAEQAQLLERLVDPTYRLITLVGTGGIGKTRLALEVGNQVNMSFPDGVWFVSLDAIKGGAEQIKITVGEAAGLGQVGKQLTGDQVLAILRDKQMLLILDNCETVLDDIAFIPTWLRRAPHIAILATSREPLNFQAESVVALAGLPTGEAEMCAAEALFAERGQMARADFTVTAVNLPHVRHICQLVDGLPLGIALAAAWVRRRSLVQISDAIDQSLDFLSTRLRDIEPRHHSMRAVLETSWQLLTTEAQAVLAALSVFPTTFTAVAAAEVADATLFELDVLCEKSLLQQQPESERYQLHSLVRQFAAQKLGERATAVDHAFVTYFYQFASQQQDDYNALQPEWRNFAAGIAKAHVLEAWQTLLDFVGVLDEPWFRQIRFNDMREGLALALDAATKLQDEPALVQILLRLSEIEMEQNDYDAAAAHLDQALALLMRLEDSLGIAQAKYLYGRIKLEQAQDEQALKLIVDSKQIFADEGDSLGIAKNLNLLALLQIKMRRNFYTAQLYLEKSVALQRELPPSTYYVETLRHLARVNSISQAYASAEAYLIEAANVSQQLNNVGDYAAVLYENLVLCKQREQFDKALAFGYACLDNFRKLGSLRWEALIKTQLGLLYQARQAHEQGLALLKEGLQIFIELADPYEQAFSYYYLYKLYAEINEVEQSLAAKRHALRLNLKLNDPYLAKRLENN